MSVAEIIALTAAIGGLPGLGALLTAWAGLRKTTKIQADTAQLRPNHGSSMADLAKSTDANVRSLGHQMGELHRVVMNEVEERQALDQRLQVVQTRLQGQIDRCPVHPPR